MRRVAFLRAFAALAVTAALTGSAAAHCLGGPGIGRCLQAAACNASTADCRSAAPRHVVRPPSRYSCASSKPLIKRMGQLSVRNRNGGIR